MYVFEKPQANQIDDIFKDGVHIVIPEIITGYNNKFKLRSIVIEEIKKTGVV